MTQHTVNKFFLTVASISSVTRDSVKIASSTGEFYCYFKSRTIMFYKKLFVLFVFAVIMVCCWQLMFRSLATYLLFIYHSFTHQRQFIYKYFKGCNKLSTLSSTLLIGLINLLVKQVNTSSLETVTFESRGSPIQLQLLYCIIQLVMEYLNTIKICSNSFQNSNLAHYFYS